MFPLMTFTQSWMTRWKILSQMKTLQTVEKFEQQKITKRDGPIGGLILCHQGEIEQGIQQITEFYRTYKRIPFIIIRLVAVF